MQDTVLYVAAVTIDSRLPPHRRQLPPHRWQLTWLPLPIGVLSAGLLINAGVTIWDLRNFDELMNYGRSMNGSIAALYELAFAYFQLILTAVLVPVLWIAARRARLAGSRSPGFIGLVCGMLAMCGGGWAVAPPNDGSDPKRLGVVHDAGVPGWVSVADVAAPFAVLLGAAGAALLVCWMLVVRLRAGAGR